MKEKEFEFWYAENYWWVLYNIESIMYKRELKTLLTSNK